MKKERKILSLLLILCLVLSFAACGKKELSDEAIMQKSVENMQALNSLTAESTMDMVFSAGGESMTMTTEMTQRMINDPITVEVIMNMDMGDGSQKMQNVVYAEEDGDNLITYTQTDGEWYKQTQTGLEDLKAYDSTGTMAIYMESMKNLKKVGTEEVAGVKASKYEGVIPEEYFQNILEASGMDDQLGLQGESAENLSNLFEGIGEMPITVWIDVEKLMPVKYDFDMSAMMKAMMKNMGVGEADLSIEKVSMSMVITGYDNVDKIDIPQEARDAQEMAS